MASKKVLVEVLVYSLRHTEGDPELDHNLYLKGAKIRISEEYVAAYVANGTVRVVDEDDKKSAKAEKDK